MYQNGCNAYRHSAIHTVEDKNLILLKLYDGAIRFLTTARQGIAENSPQLRGENISKAMAIITEFDTALDMERGGQMAQNLASLYRYAMNRLTEANRNNDVNALDEVKNILTTLKEGFEGAIRQQQFKSAPDPDPAYHHAISQEGLRCAV